MKPRYYIGESESDLRVSPDNFETRDEAERYLSIWPQARREVCAVRSLHMEPLRLRMLGQTVTFSRGQWEELLEQLNPTSPPFPDNLMSRVRELLRLEE